MTTTLPDKYHRLRKSGGSKWTNTLTIKEAASGLLDQRVKVANRDRQITAINTFNTKVSNAPDDVKYTYYQAGRKELAMAGITTKEKDGELQVFSPWLKPSTSQNVYDWRGNKGRPVVKGLVATRAFSSEAAKFVGVGLGAGYLAGGALKGLGTVAPRVAKVSTTGLKVGGYAMVGAWGAGSTYSIIKTPKEDRGIRYAEVGGQAFGIGSLFYSSYAAKKSNAKSVAKNYKIQQQAARLDNVQKYGQYSKFAKTGYKQVGKGKVLSPSVQKGLAKQFGVSQSTIRESSIYRQTLKVKSPTGVKPYTSGKWGISMSQTTAGKTQQIGGTFRFYRGKPTSLTFSKTQSFGKYSLTSQATPKGKGYMRKTL